MSTPTPTLSPSNPPPASPPNTRRIALAGNPNSGKTTLFNALTGLRQKVANYPGVTVEKKTGRSRLSSGEFVDIIDLPGTYSLVSRSPDETVACEVLRGLRADTPAPDVVVVVVDASNLPRNLYLVSQLVELGRPMVVALTMTDIAARRGFVVSPEKLEARLGVPVVPMVGHKGTGVEALKSRLSDARVPPLPKLNWPPLLRDEIHLLGGALSTILHYNPAESPDRNIATAERLLIRDNSPDLAPLYAHADVAALLAAARARLAAAAIEPVQSDVEAHYQWIDTLAAEVTAPKVVPVEVTVSASTLNYRAVPPTTLTDRLDRILIHKVWGLVIFAAVMAVLFISIFSLADPLMGATEDAVGWLGGLVTGFLPEGPIQDLWRDGIVAGVGGVVVFVPQIAILFGFLAILEDSGYLARAAFLMDRLLSKLGLSGKSFIPLLSSFACAIPGIMAARTIESPRQRLATIFVAPFMSCSARLPVYTLLIGTFFAAWGSLVQAGVMFALYAIGIVAAAGTAWVMQRFSPRDTASGFVLELPTYKRPQVTQVLRQIWSNTSKFITKAGTIIFCLSIVLWAMTYYPRLPEARVNQVKEDVKARFETLAREDVQRRVTIRAAEIEREEGIRPGIVGVKASKLEDLEDQALATAQLRQSISGRFGHFLEPAIQPLGYDWKMGVGLISAFAAREVFVSTMGIVYSVGDAEDDPVPLREAMLADRYADGSRVWTPAVAASLLVWFVIAMQCMSTLAIVRRETQTWRWPIIMLVYMNALAYLAALVTYQVLSRVV